MRKILLTAMVFMGMNYASFAQSNASATATQNVELGLTNALMIYFTSNGTAVGDLVTLQFNSVNDFQNGVQSANQELKVLSNKHFNVAVKVSAYNFMYTNPSGVTSVSNQQVEGVLDLKLTANNTGGSVPVFSNFEDLKNTNQALLSNCNYGNNQTFSVKYRATPGFSFQPGVYYTDVIYTATQY